MSNKAVMVALAVAMVLNIGLTVVAIHDASEAEQFQAVAIAAQKQSNDAVVIADRFRLDFGLERGALQKCEANFGKLSALVQAIP